MRDYFNNITKLSKRELLSLLSNSLLKNTKEFIITLNPEAISLSKTNAKINNILLADDNLIIPDGVAINFAARWLGIKIAERFPGVELVDDMLQKLNAEKGTLYVYGASEETLIAFKKIIQKKYKKIKFPKYRNGYDHTEEDFFTDLKKYKPDLILVALGVPKQELLINKFYNKVDKGIFIGVGGSIDILSETKKRAPKIFRKLRLEWLYRIIKEPKRIGRFIKYNIGFIFDVILGRR